MGEPFGVPAGQECMAMTARMREYAPRLPARISAVITAALIAAFRRRFVGAIRDMVAPIVR
jgi:hypothetical protein